MSHMIGVGECTPTGYRGALTDYTSGINSINNGYKFAFGDEVSIEAGNSLIKAKDGVFEGVNRAAAYLINHCGETQQFLDEFAKYNEAVVKSLELVGTEPQKVPYFGGLATAVMADGAHYASNTLNKVGQYVSSKLGSLAPYASELPNQVVAKTTETVASAGDDTIPYFAVVLGLSAILGKKLADKINRLNQGSDGKS